MCNTQNTITTKVNKNTIQKYRTHAYLKSVYTDITAWKLGNIGLRTAWVTINGGIEADKRPRNNGV